jgi:putative peptidoglycan lipid II flippase
VAQRFDAFRSELAHGMRLALLLTVPSTIGLMMLAEPIISTLYQHGRFDAFQAAQAAGALRFYAIGLGGYAALKVLVNAFYALDHRKTPMVVSFIAVALNLLFNWVFTFRLGWGHEGLAFSTGLVATCNFLVLYMLMRRKLGGLESGRMLSMLLKLAVAALPLIAVCAAASHWLLADWATQAFLPKLGALLATVLIGLMVFAGGCALLRVAEIEELVGALRRRLQRAG